MATRKRKTTVEEILPEGTPLQGEGEPTEFDVSLESVEDTEALKGVLSQFGETNVLLKVLRQTSTGSEFCYQSDSLDEEFIQKNFGGGDYQVRVFIGGQYKKTLKVKIANRLQPGNPVVQENPNRNNDFLEKLVLALVAGRANVNDTPAPTITDLTAALSNLDQLRGKQESTMELFMKGVTFAKEIINSGEGKDWKAELVGTVKDALPMIGKFIPGVPSQTNPPNTITQQPANLPAEQQEALIRQGLAYLKKKCISGMDPELIVEWISTNAEEYQALIGMVLNIPFDQFVQYDAEIGTEPFKPWFTSLFDGLRQAFIPPDSVVVDTTGELGDTGNAGNHGKPRTGAKPKG